MYIVYIFEVKVGGFWRDKEDRESWVSRDLEGTIGEFGFLILVMVYKRV